MTIDPQAQLPMAYTGIKENSAMISIIGTWSVCVARNAVNGEYLIGVGVSE